MVLTSIDLDLLLVLLGGLVVLLGIIIFIFGASRWVKSGDKITDRIDQFVVPEAPIETGESARPIIPHEISGSLFSRTIVNWTKAVVAFLGRLTPKSMVLDLEHKLTIADHPSNLHAGSFFAIKIVLLLLGILVAFLLNRDPDNISLITVLLGGLIILISWLFPNAWLNGQVRARQDEIQRGLPDALDMLSVCASAGLGFDQSLQKISEYWDTELGHEFQQVIEEMELGLSRSVALRNMSKRLDVDDLSRFVAILVQAERIGMSYADVLHSQALQLRVMRQLRAQEIANKLPAKMIVPLALFIFPAIIAVILGPTIPTIMGLFQTF